MEKCGVARKTTDDNIIRRISIACWITKAADTHSEYVILIVIPRQQLLRKRATALRYTYTACLVINFTQRWFNQFIGKAALFVPQTGYLRLKNNHTRRIPARATYSIPWDTRNWVAQYEQLHTKGWRRKWLVITSATCVICHLWTQRREHRHVVLAPLCPTGRVLPPASSSAI